MKRHSILSNVIYLQRDMFTHYKSSRILLPLYIIAGIASPFMDTLLPSVAIAMIMKHDMKGFVIGVSALSILMIVLGIVRESADMILFCQRVYTRISVLTRRLLHKSMTMDYEHVEPQPCQKKMQQAMESISNNNDGAERLMKEWVSFVIQFVGMTTYATAILVLDFRILLIMLVMFASNFFLSRHAIAWGEANRDRMSQLNRQIQYMEGNATSIVHGKDVRIYQMEKWFHEVFDTLIMGITKWQSSHELRWYLPSFSDQFCVAARDVLAYFVLIQKVLSGEMSVAVFALYLGLISGFSQWMYQLVSSISSLKKENVSFNKYHIMMETEDCFHHEEGVQIPKKTSPVKIQFDDVSFHYEGSAQDILSHISFTIEPGEKIALVGNNGAGKTTLVKLLLGLYAPSEGRILVNDIQIERYNLEEYQSIISVLFQDVEPISFSILENISGQSVENSDRERVRESLRKAGLWEKISSLPKQENTYLTQVLDDGGIMLSGGETQKLLLARALYKDGSMLVLDEPTAALDPIAESQMYEHYHEMTRDKTSIFISHRLASTKFCSRIFFMENGQIVEMGSHEELLEKDGKYASMFQIQSHYYQENVSEEDLAYE